MDIERDRDLLPTILPLFHRSIFHTSAIRRDWQKKIVKVLLTNGMNYVKMPIK